MKNKNVVITIGIVSIAIVAVGMFVIFGKTDKKSDSFAVNSAQNNTADSAVNEQAATQADSAVLNEQNAPVTSAYTSLENLNANPRDIYTTVIPY